MVGIRMDAGELQSSTFRISIVTKKGESRSSPLVELNQLLFLLVGILLAVGRAAGYAVAPAWLRRTGAGTRVWDDNRQVTHGKITCTNIADERKAVSVLE